MMMMLTEEIPYCSNSLTETCNTCRVFRVMDIYVLVKPEYVEHTSDLAAVVTSKYLFDQ
jgi:hypothetical protein